VSETYSTSHTTEVLYIKFHQKQPKDSKDMCKCTLRPESKVALTRKQTKPN